MNNENNIRRIIREEINSNEYTGIFRKIINDIYIRTHVKNIVKDEAINIVPKLVDSYIDNATTNALHRLFPSFINENPLINSAMKIHLINVETKVKDESEKVIRKLVYDPQYDFIGKSFREKIYQDIKDNQTDYKLWKLLTGCSIITNIGFGMYLYHKK